MLRSTTENIRVRIRNDFIFAPPLFSSLIFYLQSEIGNPAKILHRGAPFVPANRRMPRVTRAKRIRSLNPGNWSSSELVCAGIGRFIGDQHELEGLLGRGSLSSISPLSDILPGQAIIFRGARLA
jgi:hypothetical protein